MVNGRRRLSPFTIYHLPFTSLPFILHRFLFPPLRSQVRGRGVCVGAFRGGRGWWRVRVGRACVRARGGGFRVVRGVRALRAIRPEASGRRVARVPLLPVSGLRPLCSPILAPLLPTSLSV